MVSGPHPARASSRAAHVEDDFTGDLAVAHLENMHQAHGDFAAGWKMPVPVPRYFERNRRIIHDPIFGGEALKRLKVHVAHARPEQPVIVFHRFFATERAVENNSRLLWASM